MTLLIRQRLDLWANLRPVRLLPGVPTPLVDRSAEHIDMLFVRENSEGECSGVGGHAHQGHPEEVGVEVSVFTCVGVERIVRHALERASRCRVLLTSATKSNVLRYGYILWGEVVESVVADYSGVTVERVLVDALAARMVRSPDSLDVVVDPNLFGDILTDLRERVAPLGSIL